MIHLADRHGAVSIDLYGGQVMSYRPAGVEHDVLWRTSDAMLEAAKAGGKALRGGIPICWPWFGPHPTDAKAPAHGLARLATWRTVSVEPDRAVLTFATDGSNPAFPHRADAVLEVQLGQALTVTLTTTNRGDTPFRLTQGLHTYFAVGDIGRVQLRGLEAATSTRGHASPEPLVFTAEVDRIYKPVSGPLHIVDPALGRTISIENSGCTEAVVWNPWADKPDMPPGSYRQMLCVEPANATEAPTLAPGSTHAISTRIWLST